MRRLFLCLTLFTMCLCIAPDAKAARFTGAYLLEICEINAEGKEKVKGGHAACQSYIAGVLDYHSMLQSMKLAPELKICIPDEITLNSLHGLVLQYLRSNPQHDGFTAAPAIVTGLYAKYPCGKK